MSKTLLDGLPEILGTLRPTGPLDYYQNLATENYVPGWARLQPPLWSEPQHNFIPTVWRYSDARAALERAGDYVPMEDTERRNLIMVNPLNGNRYASTRNLVAAYQMIKPGETARSHRHTPNALRLVIEGGGGAFTVVNGARVDMEAGDVVLTPNWHWHSHAHDGTETAYWIDFLDIPVMQQLECMFFEVDPVGYTPPDRTEANSPYRFKSNEIAAREGLLRQRSTKQIAEGIMPSFGLFYESIPAGQAIEQRMTANNLYSVINGSCTLSVDGKSMGDPLAIGDVASVPLWRPHRLEASVDTLLLRVSDEPIYRALGQFRHVEGPDSQKRKAPAKAG